MDDNKIGQSDGNGANEQPARKTDIAKKRPSGKGNLFKRWKDPSKNQMGNDISSEVKIANSNGEKEGGIDNRWHINEGR